MTTRDRFRPPAHEPDNFLLTTVVGSFPKPGWLEHVREVHEAGELSDEQLAEAIDDACRVVIGEHERAGLDVVTDGEVRRTGMVDHFAQFIDNMESSEGDAGPGDSSDWTARMPTVVDEISSDQPWLVEDFEFAASVTDRPVKVTITGPFTLSSFTSPEGYDDIPTLAHDFAALVADEAERLVDAGVRWIQIDEPALGVSPHDALARECLEPIADRVPEDVRLGLHVCSGNYANLAPAMFSFPVDELSLEFASDDADDPSAVLEEYDCDLDVAFGVVDAHFQEVESVTDIERNIEEALSYVPPDRLTVSPDCGLMPLSRDVATGKIQNLVRAARSVEERLDAGEIDHC